MSKRKKNMGPRKWTIAQKDYLRSLLNETDANGNPFPRQVVVVFLNKKFPTRPRTLKAVEAMTKILRDETKAEELAEKIVRVKPKPKPKTVEVETIVSSKITPKKAKKGRGHHVDTTNSGKGWTTTDDRFLVENWSAIDSVREKVANHLGRTTLGCQARLWKVKKNTDYYHTLVGNVNVTIHNTIPGKPGLLEKLLTYLINRRANKQAKKVEKLQQQLAEMSVKYEN